jgi:hypothetical protein
MATSPDAVALSVKLAYDDILGHDGSTTAMAYWTSQVLDGRLQMADVITALAASFAFTNQFSTDAAMINGWYEKLLGRPASANDITYWGAHAGTKFRQEVASALVHSAEGRRHRVSQLFDRFLHREATHADAALYSTWLQQFGEPSVEVSLLESFEFDDLAQAG